ncbi:hypothetical protein R7E50_25395, partial [Vibrio sp. Vb2531]|nr:hypothetical protein [Vibrio sp. Vb2531]
FEVYEHFANTTFTYFVKLKSGAVSKLLLLKPLGTYSAVENGLTTPKSPFGQAMQQGRLSTNKAASETENPNRTRRQSMISTSPNN